MVKKGRKEWPDSFPQIPAEHRESRKNRQDTKGGDGIGKIGVRVGVWLGGGEGVDGACITVDNIARDLFKVVRG